MQTFIFFPVHIGGARRWDIPDPQDLDSYRAGQVGISSYLAQRLRAPFAHPEVLVDRRWHCSALLGDTFFPRGSQKLVLIASQPG
jgi:hypothetical protein